MTEEQPDRFCAGCGQRLPRDAGYCPACGHLAGGTQRRTRAPRTAATAVFLVLVAGGTAALYSVVNEPESRRAVSGSPSAPSQASGTNAVMPSDHPPIDLPQEITTFLDDLEGAAEQAPQDVEAWKKLARARYRAGMLNRTYFAGALQAVEHVLKLQPEDPEAIRMAANIAYESERFGDAEKLFKRYLEVDPKDPGVRTDLASAVLFQGRTEEARKMYTEITGTNPDFVQAHVNLGITLHSEGKREEAMKSFRRALELAKEPEQRERIERIIAAAQGQPAQGQASVTVSAEADGPASSERPTLPSTSGPAEAAADTQATAGAASAVRGSGALTSNASTDFQRAVDRVFADHPIVSPRIARIEWRSAASAAVHLAGFPMDQMPPVVRNKFKSTTNGKLAKLASEHGVKEEVRVDLVDQENGRVMDSLDAKELIGAFDEARD